MFYSPAALKLRRWRLEGFSMLRLEFRYESQHLLPADRYVRHHRCAQCPGGAAIDPNLLATLTKNGTPYTGLNGNLLLAPCTGTYGDPTGAGQYRGMLFFQDRSSGA